MRGWFATDFVPPKCFAYPKRRSLHRQNAKIKSDFLTNINAKSTKFAKLTNSAKYSKNSANLQNLLILNKQQNKHILQTSQILQKLQPKQQKQ
ncbi:hypothetical protein [Helicobacter sp. T3_23-1056]